MSASEPLGPALFLGLKAGRRCYPHNGIVARVKKLLSAAFSTQNPALIKVPVSDACTLAFVISDLRALRVDPSPCSWWPCRSMGAKEESGKRGALRLGPVWDEAGGWEQEDERLRCPEQKLFH